MDVLKVALPLFFSLALLEMAASFFLAGGYAKSDALTNLGVGVLQQLSVVVIGLPFILLYVFISSRAALIPFAVDSLSTWIIAVIVYEVMYYFFHRVSHRVNVLWAAHQLHHSTETMNMTVGIRLSALGVLYHWIWDLPLALLGIPPVVFLVVRASTQIYQLWFHTDLVPSMPAIERYLMTPSLHRVHHGRNDRYIDKNFGAISTVCDRLFRTYETEHPEDPVRYGTKEPPTSSSPLWLQIECFVRAVRLFVSPSSRGRWRDAFGPPSTSPTVKDHDSDVAVRRPGAQLSAAQEIGAVLLLLGCTPVVAGFHHAVHQGKWLSVGVTVSGVLVALGAIGSVLDRSLKANRVLAALAAAVVIAAVLAGWHSDSVTMVICGLLWGAGVLLLLRPSSYARNQAIVETAGPR